MLQRAYPYTRMRRSRSSEWSRRLIAENTLTVNDLVWPIFLIDGEGKTEDIASMPGVQRYTIDKLIPAVEEAIKLGIPAIAPFPYTRDDLRDEKASQADDPNSLVCRMIREVKKNFGSDIGVICDVALDPYTSHGHDGLVINGEVANDQTVDVLVRQALVQAEAGCDILAPSDMMDGRIGAIREALEENGFHNTQIMSYAAKYASKFYGPFRDAIGSKGALKGGSKATYQQDPSNGDESLHEVALDLEEGADAVMVKPGMPYLDVISCVKKEFNVPVFAYQVSGEYAMLKAAIENGWLDDEVLFESLLCFKRAGTDGIFTYLAIEMAKKLSTIR